ncbi:MAG: 3-ketoacyl-ACP reductase [Verrucomicrobia bacterium]|nr:3-ketoacyl-ACP reductase [Verrucomicrobiota bacterium]
MKRVALITGASRGIGRGIALELARIGFDLVVNYAGNQTAALQTVGDCREVARAEGRKISAESCQADVGQAADRRRLLEFAKEKFGRLDLLVNNAGITSIGRADILEATEENFDRLMAVNLKGPYFLTQQAAKWMIEQAAARRSSANENDAGAADPEPFRPKIITISSISAYAVSTNRGDYCLAKAALGMLTKLYAVRLAEYGINVYEICPGIVASDMTAGVKEKYDKLIADGLTPIRRWGVPEDVGKAVAAIAQDALPFSTGEVINVDGGFHLRRL